MDRRGGKMRTVLTIEIEVDVEFDFTPRERASHCSAGCDSSVDLLAIDFGNLSIPLSCFKRKEISYIEGMILEELADKDQDAKDCETDRKIDERKESRIK
jgi:hypothetical protein